MAKQIRACSARDLEIIDAAIHDGWFSVHDLEFRQHSGEFVLLFTHDESPEFRALCHSLSSLRGRRAGSLTVRRVNSWEFEDQNRVVWYDLNRVRYNESDGRLDVLTNIPLRIRLYVEALDLLVEPCGESGRPEPCVEV